jgi:hypothetical protein
MIPKKTVAARSLAIIIALIWMTQYSYACGPFFPQAVFTHKLHPDFPLADYAAGNLGVLQPTYARSYLYVAYRYLNGIGFDTNEQEALVALWDERLNPKWVDEQQWINGWLAARSKVPNVGPPPLAGIYRNPTGHQWYVNCLEDGFRSAIKTLALRLENFGPNSAEIHEWLIGQDAVFANCSGREFIPPPVSATSHPLLKADRAYQIAAANFYAGHFDTAEKLFRDIASDTSSPWNQVSRYLAVRTLVRKGLLDAAPDSPDTKRLATAEIELETILANDRLETIHPSARRLLGFVRFRLQPQQRLNELAHDLLHRNSGETLKQDLWDYTALLDRQHRQPGLDDLTDWIFTFQNDTGFDINHALEKWRETKSLHWFVAVIAKIDGGRTDMADILKTAATVDRTSPAYLTVLYHRIRILSEIGKKVEARKLLDEPFLRTRLKVPISAQNFFRAQRLALAQNLDEFLKNAPRTPTLITTDETGREVPDNVKRQSAGSYLDDDAVQILNKALPVQLLKEASFSKTLPVHLRRELILATWVRAVLLGNDSVALELVPEIRRLIPEIGGTIREYQNVSDANARRLEALLIMLKNPGTRPFIGTGLSRLTQLSRIDNYRDNWWCPPAVVFGLGSVTSSSMFELSWKEVSTKAILPHNFPSFMSEPQKGSARKEILTLMQFESAPNYLGKQVIDWAKKNPEDPRVPEALHWVVRSTRYGCGDERTSTVSKEAFQLLHKNYPKNEWTKKTPYWF